MKRSPLLAVFVVVLIDLMGFGIVLPLLPFYASEFHASSTSIGLLYSIYSLAQLVFSPIWGSLSDRIGRRPIMILSTFGASLAYLLFAFSHRHKSFIININQAKQKKALLILSSICKFLALPLNNHTITPNIIFMKP
jgi:MFS family permease